MRPTTFDPSKARLGNQLSTLKRLAPYLWPAGRRDLKLRVLVAVGLLIAAKLANITVPMILRGAAKPMDCKLFGRVCTPETPFGSCMVSAEGACAAYYAYGRRTEAMTA